jgi:chromate transport protein ChrA
MTAVVTIFSIIALAAIGIILLLDRSENVSTVAKLIIAIVVLILAVLFSFFLCFFRRRNRLTGVFIDWGTRLARERLSYYLFTILFIVFTAGLIVLCFFQHLAFLSHSDPQPSDNDIFLKLTPNIPLFVLNVIEFVWGLQFLKDACNSLLIKTTSSFRD